MSTKVFVINLKSATDRWERVKKALGAGGFDFTRVEAIDGRQIADYRRYVSPWSRLIAVRPIAPTEVGCWLSHRSVWQRIVDENISQALVLEDDAEPLASVRDIEGIDMNKLGWDCLRLHILNLRVVEAKGGFLPSGESVGQSIICVQTSPVFSATAYILTLDGAKKLLKQKNMVAPTDWFTIYALRVGLRHSFLLPPIVRVRDEGSSTIGIDTELPKIIRIYRRFMKRYLLSLADKWFSRKMLADLRT